MSELKLVLGTIAYILWMGMAIWCEFKGEYDKSQQCLVWAIWAHLVMEAIK